MEKNEIMLMFGMIFGLLLVIFGLIIVNIPNGIKLMLIGGFVMLIFYCVYCFIDVDKYKKQKNQELKNKSESVIEYLDKVIGEPYFTGLFVGSTLVVFYLSFSYWLYLITSFTYTFGVYILIKNKEVKKKLKVYLKV